MSALVPLSGTPEPPSSVRLTTTSRTTVYTNGSPTTSNKYTVVNSVAIANEGATAKKVSIEFSQDGVTFFLLHRTSIAADGSLASDIPGLPLFLKPGGVLTATAETANFLTVTTSSYFLG